MSYIGRIAQFELHRYHNNPNGVTTVKKVASVMISTVLLAMSGSVIADDADAGKAKAAGDADAGKDKAVSCAGCHGANGISSNPLWPNLAGQKDGYLAKQMKAFRDGTRNDPMMSPISMPLSDADIDNIAAYYSSL